MAKVLMLVPKEGGQWEEENVKRGENDEVGGVDGRR